MNYEYYFLIVALEQLVLIFRAEKIAKFINDYHIKK